MNKVCLLSIAFAVFSIGCHYSEGLEATDKAVAQFHERFNNKEFEKIFDEASTEFRELYDKKRVLRDFDKIHEYLGKVKDTERKGWAVDSEPFGLEVTANFETGFERGSAKEKFVFLVGEDRTELMAYEFNSENVELE